MLTDAPSLEFEVAPLGDSPAAAQVSSPYEFRALPLHAGGALRADQEASLREARASGHRSGLEEGRSQAESTVRAQTEAALAAATAQERAAIAAALQEFRDSRNRYFAAMEREVVRLALSIASRILHREAQLDPLLLAGVARVALEKLAATAGVTLRIPAAHRAGWEQFFQLIDSKDRPAILADPGLAQTECVLETSMGTVDLGVAAQLEEIERGFFDLMEQRPTT